MNDFLNINHFSLIIFYHSFSLGFELFESFRHNKHQTRNEAGMGMMSYQEEMVLRILGF